MNKTFLKVMVCCTLCTTISCSNHSETIIYSTDSLKNLTTKVVKPEKIPLDIQLTSPMQIERVNDSLLIVFDADADKKCKLLNLKGTMVGEFAQLGHSKDELISPVGISVEDGSIVNVYDYSKGELISYSIHDVMAGINNPHRITNVRRLLENNKIVGTAINFVQSLGSNRHLLFGNNQNRIMLLDGNTRRNLELTSTLRDGKRTGSLLWLLDKTVTAMGARLMKGWIEKPLQNERDINRRLDAVEIFTRNRETLCDFREALCGIRDIERLSARLAYGNTNPRDVLSLSETLKRLPDVKKTAKSLKNKIFDEIAGKITLNDALQKEIEAAVDPDAGAVYKDGGFIKKGYNAELDEYRDAGRQGHVWLANLEAAEKEKTGIKNLKVGYNKVFGYYIEVSKSQLDMVPLRYTRKQTLVGGERFITDELRDIENKIIGAEDNAVRLELALFKTLTDKLRAHIDEFLETGRAVATLDAIQSLAYVAVNRNYVKPVINGKIKKISVKNGRHPIVEALSESAFVPNDTVLDEGENRCMVITGPNMAGKSTYMRQVALITLMAHVGSFVPADAAEISLTDRIFTRVGASDDITLGQSTFMT